MHEYVEFWHLSHLAGQFQTEIGFKEIQKYFQDNQIT